MLLGLLPGLALLLHQLELVLLLLELPVGLVLLLVVHLLEGGVVASVVDQLLVLEVQDVRADVVQEVGVVGNHDHRVRVDMGEVVVQPEDGVQVQVVRRLVEHQQLRLEEEGLRQGDAHAPASRELHNGPVHGEAVLVRLPGREAQTAEHLPHPALRRLRSGDLQVGGDELELVPRAVQLLHGHVLARLHPLLEVLHPARQLLLLRDELVGLLVGGDDLLHRGPVARLRLLLHENHVPVQRHGHLSRGDVAHDRGLALAVRAEDAVALALDEGDRGVLEEGLPGAGEREVVADEGVAGGRWLVLAALQGEAEDVQGADEVLVSGLRHVHIQRLLVLVVHPLLLVRELLARLDLRKDGVKLLGLGRLLLLLILRGGRGRFFRQAPRGGLLLLALLPGLVVLLHLAPRLRVEVGQQEAEDHVLARGRPGHLGNAVVRVLVGLPLHRVDGGHALALRDRHLGIFDVLPSAQERVVLVGGLAHAHVHRRRSVERHADAALLPGIPEEDEALDGFEVTQRGKDNGLVREDLVANDGPR
mmetsp:Transcript_86633/g.187404  ORF Transcript_86633/g.187404 Transcript_86633/m.187404 type:complete len:533 (-) Transcript_86633:425-2023(-)